jgi:polysaccharide pyruvyl transferase WcaK-like protein
MKKIAQLKFAIYGSFGYMDIGDEAMLTADLDYLLNVLNVPASNVRLIGGDPKYIAYYHQHPVDLCITSPDSAGLRSWLWDLRSGRGLTRRIRNHIDLRQLASESDVLLISGGGTVNTRDANGFSVKRMARLIDLFSANNVPIFMSGQTIGPLGINNQHDQIAKRLLEQVDRITVRDSQYSRRYLNLIGAAPEHFTETYDDAFHLPFESANLPTDVEDWIKDRSFATMNITDYTSDTIERRSLFAKLIEFVVTDMKLDVALVAHSQRDYSTLWAIFDMLNNDVKSHVLLPDTRLWRAEMIKQLISKSRLAIGGRYHFIVFSGTSNTPFIGMNGNHYSYIKQDGFARPLGLERFIMTERETRSIDCITARITEALETTIQVSDGVPTSSQSMQSFGEWLKSRFSD